MQRLLTIASILLVVGLLVAPPGAQAVDEKAWQRIHGKVEKLEGNTLTFKTDDGKTLTADVAQVGENIRKALTPGEGVTVAGQWKGDEQHLVARFVQQDRSPSASVDEKSWQRVHGKVEKVEGNTLTFKTDDNKTVTVDMAQVGENIRKALTPGESITVAGQWKGDDKHLVARFIQQDSSNPQRGGKVTPPASPKTGK